MRIQTILIAGTALVMLGGTAHARVGEKIANQYICNFKAGAVARGQVRAEAHKAINKEMGQLIYSYDAVNAFAARLPARPGASAASDMAKLKANNAKIAGCEQDRVLSLDPIEMQARPEKRPGGGGGGGGTTETTDWGVTRVGGGANYTGSGRAFVIDTGIDLDHPDLHVDTTDGAYFTGRSMDDENGHGTHVSGTIAAVGGNNLGVKGVAAGATVIPVRVLGRTGSGSTSGVIAGVNHVATVGRSGDVANMSLGGGVSTQLDAAVLAASSKVAFALAAGNETDDADNHSPGRTDGANIVTIAAFDKTGKWASFSNYGSHVDWAEPGVSIYSTYKGGTYATLSGTSMATPHAAGLLLWGNIRQDGTVTRIAGDTYKIGAR